MTTMIGIDPHKATHTAVAINSDEQVLDEFTLQASKAQTKRLRDWVGQFDDPEWAIESARGLGYLLAPTTRPGGRTVFDVPPLLASRVRVLGSGRSQKNDPNDASSVAIAALRSHRVPRQELWVHGDDVRHARGEALEPSPGASATVSRFVRLSTEVGRRCPSSSTGSTRSASATAGRRSRSTARSSNWRWSGPVEVIGPPSGLTSDMTFTTPTTTPEPRLARQPAVSGHRWRTGTTPRPPAPTFPPHPGGRQSMVP